jgi:L-alanine-DL-glutamate epimerase-like enolase superfamily enzyme
MAGIVRFEVGRFDYDLVGEFKFFKTSVRPSIVVRLTDENGVQGWGQSVPIETWTYETVETAETTLRRYLAPAILGAEPRDLAAIHERMDRAIKPSFSVGQPLCKAAVDLACYDLWGKQTNRSASEILGGVRQRHVKLSWTVQSPTLTDLESQLALARTRGYDSFNIKLGYPQTPEYDLQLVRTVCNFAPNGFHWADANTSYDVETALAMAPKLADAGLKGLESPLPPNLIRGYQALKRQRALPILMDEGIVSPVEVRGIHRAGDVRRNRHEGGALRGTLECVADHNLASRKQPAHVRVRTDRSRFVVGGVHPSLCVGWTERSCCAQRAAIHRGPRHDRSDLPCQR